MGVDNAAQVAPTDGDVNAENVAAVTNANVNDWRSALDPELQKDASLAKFKEVKELAKSYKSLEGMLGKSKVVIPKEGDGQEVWDAFYKANGRPESSDKYELNIPEGLEIEEEVLKGYKEKFHKLGLNNSQVQEILVERAKEVAMYNARKEAADKETINNSITALRKELGAKYEPNMKNAQAVFNKFASEKMKKIVAETGIGSHPEFIKFMMDVAKTMGTDVFVNGGGVGVTPQTAASEIAKIKAGGAYFDANHPEHQAAKQRVRDLIEVVEGQAA